jgi:iron complex outermembrane receptor protein
VSRGRIARRFAAAACAAALALAAGRARAYETVVTAPPPDPQLPREDHAAAASVVLPDASPRAYDDLGTLLLDVPGVTVTRSGSLGSVATLALRGSSPDEVRIYVDGVPLAIAEGGAVDVSTLPLGDVERVEVYRGSTPIAFGESALGGIVAITTRTPGAPRATARAGAGSFDTMFGDASGGGRIGRLRLYAGAHGLSSSSAFGFYDDNGTTQNPADDNPSGVRRNADVRQADGVLRAAVDLPGRRELGLGALGFGRDQGLPGRASVQATAARFRTARALAYARYESRDDLGGSGRLAVQLFASGQRDELDDELHEVAALPTHTHDTTLSAGASATARRPLLPWLGAAAVVEGRDETFTPRDDLAPTPVGVPARRLFGAGGAELDLHSERARLDVIPSARVELVDDVVTGLDPLTLSPRPADAPITRALPVWRLGLVRTFGEAVSLKANGGRYARIPSFLELYGNSGRLLGNPALQPERGYNADLALWIDAARGRFQLQSRTTAFGSRVDDLIAWRVSAYGARAGNLSRTRVLGVEQELRLAFGRHARAAAQATYTDAEDLGASDADGAVQIPFHPRWRFYARPEVGGLSVRGAVELGAYVDGDLTAQNYFDSANLVRVPARLLVGAGVTVDVPRWQLRFSASGQNLNDSRIGDLPNWPLPGRSVLVALAWRGDFNKPRSN